MRYLSSETPKLVGKFNTGDTVTVDIYKLSDNSKVVSAAACTELGSTGYFYYLSALDPPGFEMYIWIMTNGTASEDVYGELDLNGYPDTIADSIPVNILASANTEADAGMLKSGTYADTAANGGSAYVTAPVAVTGLYVYLTFNTGGRRPDIVHIIGKYTSALSTYVEVIAYNYVDAAWDLLSDSTTRMVNSATDANYVYHLSESHYNENGEVKIGFLSSDVDTSYRLSIDQCWVSASPTSATAAEIAHAMYDLIASDLSTLLASTGSLTYTVGSQLDVNVKSWDDTTVATPSTSGYPEVTVKVGTGTGEINILSGKVPATIAAGDLAANSITASALKSDAVDEIVDATWDELQTDHTTTGTFGEFLNYPVSSAIPSGAGSLEVTYTLTLTDNGLPIANARIWVSTDSGHSNIVASDTTNTFGISTVYLDPGTYYFWRYKSGVNFTNPLVGIISSGSTAISGTGTLVDTISTARIKNVTYAGSV